nr:uncharacterized protein LOC4328950 isoform X2 [Oryza sativa Japonica Group]
MLGCYEVDIVLNLFQIKIIPSPSGLSCYLLSPSTIQLSMQVNIHKYSLIDSFLAYEQKGLRADTLSAAKVGSGGRAMGAPEGGAGARAAMFPASA